MKIKIKYFTTLRELAGRAEEEFSIDDGTTLEDILKEVASKYGKDAYDYLFQQDKNEFDPSVYFLINGRNYRTLSGSKTKLKNDDVLAIIPPIGGGEEKENQAP